MPLSRAEAESLARASAAALQAGRAAEARDGFDRLAAAGQANIQIWLLLAYSCRQLGDTAGADRAADEVLRRDERNIRALIVKGDSRQAAGDDRSAASFFGKALKLAAQSSQLPPDLTAELERVDRMIKRFAERSRESLEAGLVKAGFDRAARTPRFQESIDILLEEKQVYFQQPSVYYFPRLPQIQYYEPSEFDWAASIEAAAGEIRAELEAVLEEDGLFRPYLQAQANRPRYDFHGLLDNPAWSTLHLWENGAPVEANVARFPKTFSILQQAPLVDMGVRAPSILFSLLKPGARIAPHNGMINTRLICHLPLIVPPNCGFRVGNEVRAWEEGKLLVFDDTIEHEAWNDSDRDRVVLIFDVWRPELTLEERRAVTAIFEAIDS